MTPDANRAADLLTQEIVAFVEKNPSKLDQIINAALVGVKLALVRQNEQITAQHYAMLAALTLVKSERLNKATVKSLNGIIVRAINEEYPCSLEREFLKENQR